MSYPILYESNATDFFSLGLGTLPDAISPLVTEERNGEFVFDMSYPIDGRRADLIKNNRIIKVDAGHLLKDQRFVIKTVTPQMDNSGKTFLMIHAEHVSYLANDLAIKPIVNGIDVNASQALSIWNSNLTTPNQFTVDSDINSKNSFSWSIDKVQNGRQALGGVEGSILDHWHGEYRFDNLHISLLKHRGTTANTLLAYGRNLTTFEQEESILETYTSVYPYALLTPAGSDSESKIYTIDGLIIDSTHAANFPNRKVLPVDFSSQFENVKVGTKPSGDDADKTSTYLSLAQVQSKLKEFAQSYITTNNVGVPKVSIKVSFVDLANTVNYADVAPLEELDLCDEVPIRFSKLGIDTTAKVSRVVWNVLTDSYDSLELGEISATLGDKLTEIEQTANKAQDTADKANIVQVGADGKSTIFRGSDTPIANHVGDLWYKPNGEYMEMYQWDGVSWHFVMSTKDTHDISDKVDQAMQEMADKEKEINGKLESNQIDISQAQKDLEQVKQDTANQLADIRDSVVKDVADAKAQSKDALDKANGVDDKASQALENATEAKETATTVATDMDTVKGEISSKADKSTVDTINQTVSDQGTKITQNANDIKSKASSSDVDKLSGRVSTAETTLLQTAQGLTGKADTTQLNKLSGDLTTLSNNFSTTSSGFNASLSKIDDKVNSNKEETDSALTVAKADIKATADNLSTNYTKTTDEHNYVNSQIKESADKINLSVASVSDKVDGMEIGGGNYIENSKPDSQSGWFFSSGGTNDYKVVDGQYIELTRTGGSYHQINRQYQNDKDGWYSEIKPGDHFVISMDVSMTTIPTVNSMTYGQLRLNAGNTFNSSQAIFQLDNIIKKANVWYRVSGVVTIPNNWETDFNKATMARFLIESQVGSDTDIIRIRNIQLEKGNKATNYKPSDVDTDNKIAALQIVDDQIKSTVSNKADTSYVDQKANQITSTVGNKADISYVDQQDKKIQSTVASKADASQIIQLSNQINLKVSQSDFDNLQIGGRNYAQNGNFTDGTNGWTKFGDIDTFQIWGDGRLVYSSTKAINGFTGAGQNNIPISGNKGDNITVSFDACYFGDNPSNYAKYINIIVHYNDNSGTIVSQSKNSIDMTSSVQRYSFTIKAPTDFSTVNVRFVYDSNTLYRNKLGRVKIEKGTKATDYSDSPDDKADKANLVSQINIDKSGVLIQGKKIMIDGDATIKNAVIKSSMIDTLDASKITAGTLNAANVNIINMNVSKLVGDTTNFVQSAWNGISGNIFIDSSSINVIGDWGANTLDSWGIRSYAYNANHNLELVGNFSSTYAVGNKNINGTLVSADYEGDFVGIGYRNKVGDNFTPMVGYFKQDQTALGWYQGTNIVGHLILHDYIKPLGGTGDYIQVGTINFNNIKYAYIGNSSGKAGFAYGSGYMYLISQGSAYRMAGWKIPIDIASDGKVKTWIELPGSAS